MIIATSSLPYRNRFNTNILEQVACAKNDGFSACELHGCYPGQEFSAGDVAAIAGLDMTLSVHANYRGNNISSLDSELRMSGVSQIKADILFAEAIKARTVVVHPGKYEPGCREAAYGQLNSSLQELLPFAREHHVLFTLENMDGTENKVFSSSRDVERVLALHPALQLTVDLAHLGMTGQDVSRFLNAFERRISHFHVSGAFGGKSHTEVSLQDSQVDFGPCLNRIRDWDMMMTIENSGRPETMQSRTFIEQAFRGAALNRRAM
ncbi:MAG: sugar phosphate isomerase/epimerase family protein [Syntrophales bacterium]|jgi:sugar phosphate isomerase/epimerase|nr:sugar phosphate isomerase/epimerase family protein [Syntrophales bacterium]